VSEQLVRRTSTAQAPWLVVEGLDAQYRGLTAGEALLDAMTQRLGAPDPVAPIRVPRAPAVSDQRNVLDALVLDQPMSRADYDAELERLQGRLNGLSRHSRFRARSAVVVFEGSDAAGKGGAIRRITAALDARQYQAVPIAAPTEEERTQPYLWRFWRNLPRDGRFALFDRSWYGRVLVERVEGYCSQADWMRAYGEINDFESELCAHGTIVVKFWLEISKQEQLARFREREKVDFKKYKITREDWRNRRRWGDYRQAVCDMVDHTSTDVAPWILVEANNKQFARIKVLSTLVAAIEKDL